MSGEGRGKAAEAEATDSGAGESLGQSAVRAARHLGPARALAQFSMLPTTIILARFLAPSEFGMAAIGVAIAQFAIVVLPQALAVPLVQLKALREEHLESAAFVALLLGLVAGGIVFVAGTLLALPVVQLSSVVFVLSAVYVVPNGILSRRLDFLTLGVGEVLMAALNAVIAISLAAAGVGAMSMVIGYAAGFAAMLAFTSLKARPVRPRWSKRYGPELREYGVPGGISGAANMTFKTVDYLYIGATLGSQAVGFYQRGFQLAIDFPARVSSIMLSVAFPLYARAESLAAVRALRVRIVRVHATALFPALIWLLLFAPVVVPALYGEVWRPSVAITQVLCIGGLLSAVMTGTGPVMLAAGKPQLLLRWNIGTMVVFAGAVVVGAEFGAIGVAWSYTLFQAANFCAVHWFLLRRHVEIPVRSVAKEVGPAALACLAAACVGEATQMAVAAVGASPELGVVAATAGFALGYVVVLAAGFPALWADLRRMAARNPA